MCERQGGKKALSSKVIKYNNPTLSLLFILQNNMSFPTYFINQGSTSAVNV